MAFRYILRIPWLLNRLSGQELFMPIKMAQREIAEWILDILVKDLGLKPGNPVPDHELKQKYRARKGDSADISVGLKYAEAHEWMAYNSSDDTWHLTELGYQYA
jgi:hypothetical protein